MRIPRPLTWACKAVTPAVGRAAASSKESCTGLTTIRSSFVTTISANVPPNRVNGGLVARLSARNGMARHGPPCLRNPAKTENREVRVSDGGHLCSVQVRVSSKNPADGPGYDVPEQRGFWERTERQGA